MECLKCHKIIDDDDLYCGYCGTNQADFQVYLDKVNQKIHKERDLEHQKRVSDAMRNVRRLTKLRSFKLDSIERRKWKWVCSHVYVNKQDGKVKIDNRICSYSDIDGAMLNENGEGIRFVTQQSGKATKHGSISGAIVGNMVAGRVGAVIGGVGLGDTTYESTEVSTGIPTCSHLGVVVSINGFEQEIVLLRKTVDKSNYKYINAYNKGVYMISKLNQLSMTPVPTKIIANDKNPAILAIDDDIQKAIANVDVVKAEEVTYEIPAEYFE